MRITWSEQAVHDLESVHEDISREAPGRAAPFVGRLVSAVEPLLSFPLMGRTVPEGDGRQREVIVDPYRIVYRVEGEEIFVVTVIHGARDLTALLDDPPTGSR